jgi:glycosyltransferase involved in cell wall biosynthesis
MHIGIDATELAAEHEGKVRHLQSVIEALGTLPNMQLTLLAESSILAKLKAHYAHSGVCLSDPRTAKRKVYDLVWYPWGKQNFRTKSPFVATIHSLAPFTKPAKGIFTRWREQGALKRIAHEASEIICHSHWFANIVANTLDRDRNSVHVLSPAPDASWFPALEPSPFSELTDMPYVLIASEDCNNQNLDVFFDSFARAFKKREIRLVFCGTVPDKLTKSFTKITHTTILQPNENELRALYRNAAAVAIPADKLPFSFVASEASACGAAVIAAQSASLPEILGNAALLIEPRDRGAWITGLQEITDDSATNAKFRAQAVARWNSNARTSYVDQLVMLFQKVVSRTHD